MVLNTAVQALREAEEIKEKLLGEKEDTIVTTSKTILLTQLQKAYQKVLLMDLDYALDKKVEQDLWNLGFKNQIESLQNSTKDKKNPRRAESQILLNWCIQAATGYYISLLHQICTSFNLNLPFRCNIPSCASPPLVPPSSPRPPQASSCWYICQYCLVHLGDLARYTRQLKTATSFYKQALCVSPSTGQAYNQLGLVRACRGDRVGAAYYHVRGLAVGGPFLPSHNNLNKTLQQANQLTNDTPLSELDPLSSHTRLSPNLLLMRYLAVHHHIINGGDMAQGRQLAQGISSSLTALVATQQFHQDVLIELCCISLYSVFFLTEGRTPCQEEHTYTEEETGWLGLAMDMVASTLEALLLPGHTLPQGQLAQYQALPAIKVLLEWMKQFPSVLKHTAFISRPQLWPGLCVLLSALHATGKQFTGAIYNSIPLPEDEELRGFLPIDKAFKDLKFSNTVSSGTYGDSVVEIKYVLPSDNSQEIAEKDIIKLKKQNGLSVSEGENLKKDKHFVESLRGYRIVELGKWLVELQKQAGNEVIIIEMVDDTMTFVPKQNVLESDPELLKTIKELSLLQEKRSKEETSQDEQMENTSDSESKALSKGNEGAACLASGDMSPCTEGDTIPPPIIISEADFREKVREKKAGILKPQGSLERARIEKAALTRAAIVRESPGDFADTQDAQDTGSSCSTVSQDGNICSDVGSLLEPSLPKEKGKKTRTNVALQAILRKQEESSKQVKFLTPVTTPDSISDSATLSQQSAKEVEKKIIQPKIIKSLASLPTDRKTGGILSLKDKSGGYPHLQNTVTSSNEATESTESVAKHSTDSIGEKVAVSPNKQAVKTENVDKQFIPAYTPWSDNIYNKIDDKSASGRLQAQSNFSYFSPPGTAQNMNITLPVVNPKEIDVRSAAMQKQKNTYGTAELYGPPNYGVDNTMPAYNYWSAPPNPNNPNLGPRFNDMKRSPNEHQLAANNFNSQSPYSMYQPGGQNTRWKPTGPEQSNFDRLSFQSGSQMYPSMPNNYNSPNFTQVAPGNPSFNQGNYYPQNQDYSKMGFNGPMGQDFGGYHSNMYGPPPPANNYGPSNAYNQGVYPQFTNRFGFPGKPKSNEFSDNAYGQQQFGSNQIRPGPMQNSPNQLINENRSLYQQVGQSTSSYMDKGGAKSNEGKGNVDGFNKHPSDSGSLNMYSLFSGSSTNTENAWPTVPQQNNQQSLWSGPGPSPLERLLEQQKMYKFPPNE